MNIVTEIFEKADLSVSTPFIHALTPGILIFLNSDEAKDVHTKPKLEFILESIRSIQTLIHIVDAAEKRELNKVTYIF